MVYLDRVVKVTLRAMVAEYNKGMLQAAQATRTVGTEAEKLAQKRQAFETLGRGLAVAGAAMVATAALATRAAAQWESAWAGVTKTVDGTPAQMAKVEQGLRDLTKILPASHTEIAAVAEAAGQLGVQTENVVAFTRTMIDLGETTNLSANDAATQLARFVNIMGTSQSEVSNLGSALVGLGNNYATTESEILAMSMRLAGAGKQVGLTEGDVLGLATALSSVGIEAEAGGSAVSKVLIDIAASVEKGGDRLKMFADVAGVSADEFAAKWRTAPAAAMSLFVSGLANAESQGSSTLGILAELGITEVRMRDALLRSASAADMFAGAMELGNTEFEKNNALTAEAAKRYETVESKMAMAGNAINDMAISFGEVLLPVVGMAADAIGSFADFMGDLPGPVMAVISVLGVAGGAVALVGGAALLAIPKIAEFKVAIGTLGTSMRGLSLAGGAVGLALTALVTIIGAVAAAQAEAQARAQAYSDALSQGEEAARRFIAEQLAMKDSFLWMDRGSAVENARKLGISIDEVTAAVTGSTAEFKAFEDRVMNAYKAAGSTLDAGYAMEQLKNKVTDLRDAQELSAATTKNADQATQSLTNNMDPAARAAEELGAAADQAAGDLDAMKDALDGVAGSALAMGDAKDAALSALNSMRDAAKESGTTLDGTNDASIRFRDSLRDLEDRARSSADAIIENGGSAKEARKEWQGYRNDIIDQLEAMGMSEAAARSWADENLGSAQDVKRQIDLLKAAFDDASAAAAAVPNVSVDVTTSGIDSAINRLNNLRSVARDINGMVTTVRVGTTEARATGGAITGPGTGTSDSIPIMASNGEHMLTAADVQAMGGQAGVYAFRRNLHGGRAKYASGGAVVSRAEYVDWARYVRRGEARAAGMGGNGLDLVDRLFGVAAEIGGKYGKRLSAEAYRSEKSFRSLEKQSERAATVLERTSDRLKSLRDDAASMASRVASAVRSWFNAADLAVTQTVTTTSSQSSTIGGISVGSTGTTTTTTNATTGKSIATSLAASASKIKSFADKLKRLAKKGLNPKLLEELALLGVEQGEPIVDALLSASKSELTSINDSYAAIGKYSNQAGDTVADANFEKLIAQAEKDRDAAERNAEAIQKKLERETTRLIRGITEALKAGRVIKKADGGPIYGPGTATSDSIPAFLSNGENVWSAAHVQAWGGQGNVERLKRLTPTAARYATGGPVGSMAAQSFDLGPALISEASMDRLAVKVASALVQVRSADAQDAMLAAARGVRG